MKRVSFRDALSRLGISAGGYRPKAIDSRKRRAADKLARWMNQQHVKCGAMLRELSRQIAIAEEVEATTLVEQFAREFSMLETFFDDLARPEFAAEFLKLKDSIEAIASRAPVELFDDFPRLTPEYRAYLQELVA